MDNSLCVKDEFIPHTILYNSPMIKELLPEWNKLEFTQQTQIDFINKYFPDRVGLYNKLKYPKERELLFVYLWLYMNGGVYINRDCSNINDIIKQTDVEDLYFILDADKYISTDILISRPFCEFWIDVIETIDKRKDIIYNSEREHIDNVVGKILLTDLIEEYIQYPVSYKYKIITNNLNGNYDETIIPILDDVKRNENMSYAMKYSNESVYMTSIIIIAIIVIISLLMQ